MSNRRCAMPSRSRPERWLAAAVAAAWLAAVPAAKAELTREQVDARARTLRDLPGLNATKVERSLRLKLDDETPERPKEHEMPSWLRWLTDFVDWLNESGRFLVWFGLALAVALLVLRLRGVLRGQAAPAEALHLPTHVRELDIRPESLPEDIGAAALALWRQRQARAAMSLLYRGALSVLVHRHAVPIRASSTEGDCLRLARPQLGGDVLAYLEGLVGAWRQTVYADRPPADTEAERLCTGFALQFPRGEAGT